MDKNKLYLLIKYNISLEYLEYFESVDEIIEIAERIEKDKLLDYELFRIAIQIALHNVLTEGEQLTFETILSQAESKSDSNLSNITAEQKKKLYAEARQMIETNKTSNVNKKTISDLLDI